MAQSVRARLKQWAEYEQAVHLMDRRIMMYNAMEPSDIRTDQYRLMVDRRDDVIAKMIQARNDAIELINLIKEDKCRSILQMRYIDQMRWTDIADAMGYEVRWLHRLHAQSLDIMEHKQRMAT